ncbi:HlyD family secretion protein [Caproiciproducens sp. R1]|uniref:HlyD family secretion protein n=1 Tax=Caproiciproducens sp. R1 TaxID=3435000 RepID=UPI00403452F7
MKDWLLPVKDWILFHKKTALAGACALAALFVVLGIFFHQKSAPAAPQKTDSAASANQSGEIDAWGEVKYTRMEDISVDFPSIVTDVLVKEGERVTLGQPLVALDLSEYSGNVEKLKQQLAANQAALPAAAQDTAALEADIAQTQSQIARKTTEYNKGTSPDLALAQTQLDAAKRNLSNYQALYNAGGASKETLNQYKDAVTQATETLKKTKNALKDELDQLNVSLKSKQAQLAQLKLGNTANTVKQQGGVSAAQVDLDAMTAKTAKTYLKGNQIISDIKNGIVQNITVSNAAHLGVQGAPTRVLQIIDADSITISAEVDEEFIGSIKVGETVRIVPTSAPDASLTGTVTQIPDLAVEKDGKRVVRVLVKPDDPNGLLKPGYTADVYFSK